MLASLAVAFGFPHALLDSSMRNLLAGIMTSGHIPALIQRLRDFPECQQLRDEELEMVTRLVEVLGLWMQFAHLRKPVNSFSLDTVLPKMILSASTRTLGICGSSYLPLTLGQQGRRLAAAMRALGERIALFSCCQESWPKLSVTPATDSGHCSRNRGVRRLHLSPASVL